MAELALIAAAVEDLPKILTDGARQSDAPLSPMAEHLLQGSPASAAGIDLLCDALAELAAAWPKARPLRILEIGASGGGATRRILDRLAQSGVALAYTSRRAPIPNKRSAFFSSEILCRGFRLPLVAGRWEQESERGSLRRHLGDKCLRALAARSGFPRRSARPACPGRILRCRRSRAQRALGRRLRPEPQTGGSQHHGHTIHRRCAPPRIGGASSPQRGSNPPVSTTASPGCRGRVPSSGATRHSARSPFSTN